jgi:hypothetical protein
MARSSDDRDDPIKNGWHDKSARRFSSLLQCHPKKVRHEEFRKTKLIDS